MGTTQMTTTMKAVTQREYGAPEQMALEELPVPAIGEDEVLVRVHAAGVDPGVWLFATGEPRILRAAAGLRRPKHPVPGRALAGRVEAVGSAVTRFRPGDDVYGELPGGAYAEYAAAPEKLLATMPAGLTHEEAATLPLSGT